MVEDLDTVLEGQVGEGRVVLAGDSMGAHTAVAYALAHANRLAGLIVIRPVYTGPPGEESLESWDRLADGLERGGIDGFMAAFDRALDPAWRDTVLRFTRQRMLEHLHLDAVARALHEVPRSAPFDTLAELEFCDVPALVVASNDQADPKHPFAVAAAYAERLPDSRLISEADGEPPLAWRGGKLSLEIAAFCAQSSVASRFG
jgi:pimeloyl-ACP methyl ester carboxylesterase